MNVLQERFLRGNKGRTGRFPAFLNHHSEGGIYDVPIYL